LHVVHTSVVEDIFVSIDVSNKSLFLILHAYPQFDDDTLIMG